MWSKPTDGSKNAFGYVSNAPLHRILEYFSLTLLSSAHDMYLCIYVALNLMRHCKIFLMH